MRHGKNPIQREFFEAIVYKRGNNFAHDPLSPKFFAEPVAKFCGMPMNIFSGPQTDPTDRRASDVDTKIQSRQTGHWALQKLFRVFNPVGMRRSEEHTSELQSRSDLVCRLLLE